MRKFYYLKPNIQYAFTGAFTLLGAVEIAIFTFMLYVVEHLNVHRSYDILLYIRFSIIFVMVLIISGFNFWFGTRLSHRIVGPMIQIQRVLEKALKGKYDSKIQLRSNDYLHEIAEDLNLLLEKLDDNKSADKNKKNRQSESENNENKM